VNAALPVNGLSSDWLSRYIEGSEVGVRSPGWLSTSYGLFAREVLNADYPCYFGRQAVQSGDLFVAAVEGDDLESLPQTLITFTEISRSRPDRRNNLATFFKPTQDCLSHERYFQLFWSVLQWLHDRDPLPGVMTHVDPESPLWEFSFGGEQFFVVGASPTYRRRHSRNLGPGLIMVFQPRDVFERDDSGNALGNAARERVRRGLRHWDAIGAHRDLGTFGDPDNFEWKQYFLPDDESAVTRGCPLNSDRRSRR
jgi:FPC/CPF motif-containing protein YcgG